MTVLKLYTSFESLICRFLNDICPGKNYEAPTMKEIEVTENRNILCSLLIHIIKKKFSKKCFLMNEHFRFLYLPTDLFIQQYIYVAVTS